MRRELCGVALIVCQAAGMIQFIFRADHFRCSVKLRIRTKGVSFTFKLPLYPI